MINSIPKHLKLLILSAMIVCFTGCGANSQPRVDLTVSAAASMTDALREIQQNFEAKYSSIRLFFNFGASGALQKQIEQGALVDVYISAAVKSMQALVDRGLVDSELQTNLLRNVLVVITPPGGTPPTGMSDLTRADLKRVAIGIPETVPAGSYAKESLVNAGVWDDLQPKLILAKDVRQVLQYMETGNIDAGFVYKTDALASDNVQVAFAVDLHTYTPVEYSAGIVSLTKHPQEAAQFYNYLRSTEALEIFLKHGFSAVDGS